VGAAVRFLAPRFGRQAFGLALREPAKGAQVVHVVHTCSLIFLVRSSLVVSLSCALPSSRSLATSRMPPRVPPQQLSTSFLTRLERRESHMDLLARSHDTSVRVFLHIRHCTISPTPLHSIHGYSCGPGVGGGAILAQEPAVFYSLV